MVSIECPICNKFMKRITGSHLRTHGHTAVTFKNEYPGVLLEPPELKKSYGSQTSLTRELIKQTKTLQKQQREYEYSLSPKLCKTCNTPIPYDKHKQNDFCNHSCRAKTTNRTRTISESAKRHISERAKMNKSRLIESTRQRQLDHPPYTRIYFNTCKICKVQFVSQRTSRKTCSPSCKSQIHSINNFRQNKTRGKCGWFRGIWCASSWELAFVAYHIHLCHDIKRFDSSIPYMYMGKQKRYFPDFIVHTDLYEVKGWYDDTVDIKLQAARSAGWSIHIISKADIQPIIRQVKTWYNVKNITDLYGCMVGIEPTNA